MEQKIKITTNGFSKELGRKFIKSGRIMAAELGSRIFNVIYDEFKETGENPTIIFLDLLINELRNQGYHDTQIARWIFEEAVDHLVTLQLRLAVKTIKKYRKVPKWIYLPGNIAGYID